MRPSAGILARSLLRRGKLRIHVHRKRVFTLPGVSDSLNVSCIIPRHENFVCCVSKYLAPALALLIEVCCKFRRKLKTLGYESARQRVGYASLKQAVGLRSAVPSALPEITDFVLYLHHQDRLLRRVLLANMTHQGRECPTVRAASLRR